jgi:hypothetical protein
MHTVLMILMIACGPIDMVNAFRRVSRGFGVDPTRNGHIAPVTLGIFSLFAALGYHMTWVLSTDPQRVDLVGAGLAAFCVGGTLLLWFYDPAKPRNRVAMRKKA